MSIENLRNALPSYAKDMNLNLSSLPRITSLTEQQLWGAILATAAATKVDSVIVEIAAEAKEHLSDTALSERVIDRFLDELETMEPVEGLDAGASSSAEATR